jgi:hypothetical protein
MEEYKGYMIRSAPALIGYEVEFIGRGSQPLSLRGIFTDKRTARKFIDIYVEGKEVKSGEKLQRSGSEQIQRRTGHRRKPINNS